MDAYTLRANASWAAAAYAKDVDQVYDNGFAGVKIDNCGDDDAAGFVTRVNNIKNRSTPVLIENSNQGMGWGPPKGLPTDPDGWCDMHMYRVGGDIGPDFDGCVARLQNVVPFTNTTPISRPGCWACGDRAEVSPSRRNPESDASASAEYPRRGRDAAATRLNGISTSPAAAAPRPVSAEYPRPRPRRRRDPSQRHIHVVAAASPPQRHIHVVAAAAPRPVSAEGLHGIT